VFSSIRDKAGYFQRPTIVKGTGCGPKTNRGTDQHPIGLAAYRKFGDTKRFVVPMPFRNQHIGVGKR
jgi:hypothetical protein